MESPYIQKEGADNLEQRSFLRYELSKYIAQGHAGSSSLLKQATYFMPLFLVTFFPSSVSLLISLTHSSIPSPSSPSPSSKAFSTLSKLGCLSKWPFIQSCKSFTSVIVYTMAPGLST